MCVLGGRMLGKIDNGSRKCKDAADGQGVGSMRGSM